MNYYYQTFGEVIRDWRNNRFSVYCFGDGRERLCQGLNNIEVGDVVHVVRNLNEYRFRILRSLTDYELSLFRQVNQIPLYNRVRRYNKRHFN